MRLLQSRNTGILAPGGRNTQTLNASSMPINFWLKSFWLRIELDLEPTVGASVIWQPEQIARVVDRIKINHNGISVNLAGNLFHLIERVRTGRKIGVNRVMLPLTQTFNFWLPIRLDPVLTPEMAKGFRMRTERINDAAVEVTVTNPFPAVEIAQINGMQIELWGQWTLEGEESPNPGGIYIQDFSDFPGQVLDIEDYILSLALVENRNFTTPAGVGDWSTLDGTANNGQLYQNVDSDDLDCLGYEHQMPFLPYDMQNPSVWATNEKTEAGDLAILNFPDITGEEPVVVDWTKVFDARTFKGAQRPYSFNFNNRLTTTAFPYLVVGWQGV